MPHAKSMLASATARAGCAHHLLRSFYSLETKYLPHAQAAVVHMCAECTSDLLAWRGATLIRWALAGTVRCAVAAATNTIQPVYRETSGSKQNTDRADVVNGIRDHTGSGSLDLDFSAAGATVPQSGLKGRTEGGGVAAPPRCTVGAQLP